MEIQDRVIIVTGASYGIGEAAARLLSENGARLVLAARSADRINALAEKLPGSFPVPTDMTDFAAIRAMVRAAQEHFGRVDGLCNNAGQGYVAALEEIDPDAFDRLFRLNVLAPLVAMQEVIPLMRRHHGGAIVNVSSGTALMRIPRLAAYSATKRALNGISLTAREELAAENIAVSTVYPYITATDFHRNAVRPDTYSGGTGPAASSNAQAADTAEDVAKIILAAFREGEAEYFAHDWMRAGR